MIRTYEEKLWPIFENVNQWLKFGEAKNAAMLAGNIAIIFSTPAFVSSYLHYLNNFYYLSFIFLISLSTFISLLSIIPQKNFTWTLKSRNLLEPDIYFFGHLATLDKFSLIEELGRQCKINSEPLPCDFHLAHQIIVNSKITDRKFNMFKTAAWLMTSAFLTPVVGLILYLVLDHDRTNR